MIETHLQTLANGITLSCRAAGKPGRPVLMFLHGFPEAAFVWDELMVHFAQPDFGGYRCIAPNLRGFEQSSAPREVEAYRAKHVIQDIALLIEAVAGGGDTVAALNVAGVADRLTYVSAAGGAFLEWLEGKRLPGVEVLRVK